MIILVIKGLISGLMVGFEDFASIDLVQVRSVFDPKVVTVADEHLTIMPNFIFYLVKAAQLIVVENAEEEIWAVDLFQTTLQIPRLGSKEPENVVVLRFANRNGRPLVVTDLMEDVRRKVMPASRIE